MAILPHARTSQDDPPMTLSRRSKPSRVWQVEQLEDRALLTTVYGPAPAPASFNSAPALALVGPSGRWTSEFAKISADDQGRFLTTMKGTEFPDLGLTYHMRDKLQARSAFSPIMGTVSFETAPSEFGRTEAFNVAQGFKIGRFAGGSDGPPPPFAILATRAVPAIAFSGRGPMNLFFSVFGRPRDDMEGPPPRLGPRPMLLVISPESYWENGIIDKSAESFSFVATETSGPGRSASSPHTESTTSEATGPGQAPATPPLTGLASGSSAGNVMIWVDSDTWTSATTLSSIILSQGEFEPGALFPEDDLPDLTALLASLLDEWLDDSADLSIPLANPLRQITQLDPLDESSLALTATLLTVSGDPQPQTAGPSPTPETAPIEVPLPIHSHPPSWAGFVIGLDEAFEANRVATRRWPSATEPQTEAGPRDGASRAARTVEPSAADEAIPSLDQEPPPRDAVDALFLPPLEPDPGEQGDEPAPTGKERRLAAAARASLSLAIVPALWAERLSRRRDRATQDDRAED